MHRSLIAVAFWWLGAALPAQSTWIVDAAGTGHFLDIPPAIATAVAGDRIVVLAAATTYSAFLLSEGIDVDAGAGVRADGIEIVGVPAGQRARVAGFQVPLRPDLAAVSVRSCAGSVTVVDVQMIGLPFNAAVGRAGLEILDSSSVFVDRGLFVGQNGSSAGSEGLLVQNSRCVVLGASFTGRSTFGVNPSFGSDGKAGVRLEGGSHALLCAVSAVGGNATSGLVFGGDGGDGVQTDASSTAIVLDASHLEGRPGGGGATPGSAGFAARGNVRHTLDCTLVGPAAATSMPNRPAVTMPAAVAVGSNLVTTIQGEPLQAVWLGFDLAHEYLPHPQLDGAIVLTANAVLVAGIVLDGLGAGSCSIAVPNSPWARHLDVFGQGAAMVAGSLVVTAPDRTRTQ